MENRELLRKRLRAVLKAALWGAAVPTVLGLLLLAHAVLWPGEMGGALIILLWPADLLKEAMGFPTSGPWASRFELYVLPYLVNAAIGALVFALPVAFLEAVDYFTKPPPK